MKKDDRYYTDIYECAFAQFILKSVNKLSKRTLNTAMLSLIKDRELRDLQNNRPIGNYEHFSYCNCDWCKKTEFK